MTFTTGINLTIFLIILNFGTIYGYGPVVQATKGEVWPKPMQQEKSSDYFVVVPDQFEFIPKLHGGCPGLLHNVLDRYLNIIKNSVKLDRRGRYQENRNHVKTESTFQHDPKKFLGPLTSVDVYVSCTFCCSDQNERYNKSYPFSDEGEHYFLDLNGTQATINGYTIWAVMRGLETFSQLLYAQDNYLMINATYIEDRPRFQHRGLLIDTSRHFLPVYSIMETLDAMSYNKLNVLHWHMTDDQSFPFQSKIYPELSDKGAYHPISRVYTPEDVQNILEFARVRGIRVLTEFDVPGHTSSWGVSHPELLTSCEGQLGPMDPTKNSTYELIENLFLELFNIFPDEYFHVGGDEVDMSCWSKSAEIKKFMEKNNIPSYEKLQNYFIEQVLSNVKDHKKSIVWEEVFVTGAELPFQSRVQVWKSEGLDTLKNVTAAGYEAIFSSCWYLDYLYTGGDWERFYDCDPQDFDGTDAQKELVVGGEACMWGESVNEYNLSPRVWPRASAAAEKLWSRADVKDIWDAKQRLEEHTCRMNVRGISAQPPNGPGVCL